MSNKVWLFGLVAACALAALTVQGIPVPICTVLKVVAVVCGVLAGYHYPSPPGGVGKVTIGPALGLLVLALLAAGCKVGTFSLDVKSPTFGSVGLSLDGGRIGRGMCRTNAPTPQSATNSATR